MFKSQIYKIQNAKYKKIKIKKNNIWKWRTIRDPTSEKAWARREAATSSRRWNPSSWRRVLFPITLVAHLRVTCHTNTPPTNILELTSAHHRSNKNLWSSKIQLDSPSPRSQITPRTNDIQKKSAGARTQVCLAGFQLISAAPHRHKWLVPCQTLRVKCGDSKGEGSLRRIFMYTGTFIKDRSILRSQFEGHHPSFQSWKIEPSSLKQPKQLD